MPSYFSTELCFYEHNCAPTGTAVVATAHLGVDPVHPHLHAGQGLRGPRPIPKPVCPDYHGCPTAKYIKALKDLVDSGIKPRAYGSVESIAQPFAPGVWERLISQSPLDTLANSIDSITSAEPTNPFSAPELLVNSINGSFFGVCDTLDVTFDAWTLAQCRAGHDVVADQRSASAALAAIAIGATSLYSLCSALQLPAFGPFHRKQSLSQPPEMAALQELSGEMWGRAPRFGIFPAVKAYGGPLPGGARGIEFYTNVQPDPFQLPHMPKWTGPRPGVQVDDEFAKIACVVTKNTQR
jgi:hypothetical protein